MRSFREADAQIHRVSSDDVHVILINICFRKLRPVCWSCDMKRTFISFLSTFVAMTSVHAEILLNVQGDGVLIHTGRGFVSADTTTEMHPGDTIMIRRNASGAAQLVYEDRCVVSIRPGDMRRVGKSSPCSFMARQGEPSDPRALDERLMAETKEVLGSGNIAMGAVGAGVIAGSLGAGIYAATRPANSGPVLPLVQTPCASAGC